MPDARLACFIVWMPRGQAPALLSFCRSEESGMILVRLDWLLCRGGRTLVSRTSLLVSEDGSAGGYEQDVVYTDMATTWISTERGLLEDKMAVFSAEFRLFCKSEQVKGAALKVAIVYRSGSEAYVPKVCGSGLALV
eukprot:3940782-Rhodomonas_salina.3